MTNLKSIKPAGEGKVLEQFIPKKQNITVVFKDDNYDEVKGVWSKNEETYKDIKGYQLSGPYLVIQLHDDTQHVYPMDGVSKLTLTVTQE